MSLAANAPAITKRPGVISFDWYTLAVYCEWLVAAGATLIVVHRHWLNLKYAGALWRDEANTAEFAKLPSWRDIIENLQWDSFPILSTALLRIWGYLPGGTTDEGLRWIGLLVGVGILAGLWWLAYRAHGGPPSLALLLWGMNPVAVRFGDSVRPHGLGILWMVLVWSSIARVVPASKARDVEANSTSSTNSLPVGWMNWLVAGTLSIAAVQTLFPNAVILGGLLAAGVVAALGAHHWRRALGLVAVGAAAAASLLPYLPAIRTASEWSEVFDMNVGVAQVFSSLQVVLTLPVAFFSLVWFFLPIALVGATVLTWWSPTPAARARRFRSLFALLAGLFGCGGYFVLVDRGSFFPQAWHWLPVLALGAAAAEQVGGGWRAISVVRSGLLVLALLASATSNQRLLSRYLTNIDLAAAHVTEAARPGDLIIVEPWYWSVSFHRYYHGRVPWLTIPPLEVTNLHRYDLLRLQLQADDATAAVKQAIAQTLRAGGRVWIVGDLPRVIGDEAEFEKVRGQQLSTGARAALWSMEVGYFLQQHEQQRREVTLLNERPIMVEEVTLFVAEGWRP
ncbi:MAG: hypothetical protein K2Y37_05280 [Pirellulales bacterium]|nr:hypothetical protein [Pirellulales bacterium]